MANFRPAFEYTLTNEGGYTNDPSDPGGQTNLGITQDDFSSWEGEPVTTAQMKALTVVNVRPIYLSWWWKPLALDKVVEQNLATCIFDIGVNRGIVNSAKYAQRALNVLRPNSTALVVDGVFGPLTLNSINSTAFSLQIQGIAALLRADYQQIAASNPSQQKFLAGWLNRADRLLTLLGEDQVA